MACWSRHGASEQQGRLHLDINVTGVWNTVMVSADHLIAGGGGSVVLISSYAGKKVQPSMVSYTTSKHAVAGMTRAFAAELGKHRIRVNSIHPGAVDTPMGTPFLPQFVASADEISSTVLFLASDDSGFITSEHISVDGGAQNV
ncbi:MAG: SDR family oxidoreductase [Aeromicrobium sp.]